MGFITSPKHFIAVLNKTLRENHSVIDIDKLLSSESYIDFIYAKKLTDRFTWDLRSNPRLLEEDLLIDWLRIENATGIPYINSSLEHIITAEFSDTIKQLKDIPGV